MCDFPSLNRKMFEALEDIKAGWFVFVIARKPSEGREVTIEDVVVDEILNPQLALENYSRQTGKPMEHQICLPVILPPGLQVEGVKGFRPVHTATALWIEYTGTK